MHHQKSTAKKTTILRPTLAIFSAFVLVSLLSACGLFPTVQSKADPRVVLVWPEADCPSEPAPQSRKKYLLGPAVAGVITPLISDIVGTLVGIPTNALQAAAAADTAGFTANGQSARYYYTDLSTDDHNAPVNLLAPGCYVVAYTQFVNGASVNTGTTANDWCSNADFKGGVPDSCENGRDKLQNLKNIPPYVSVHMAVPDFYAEIKLEPQSNSASLTNAAPSYDIVSPKVIAIYYPKSLLKPGSTDPRTLSITLTLSSAAPATASTPDPMAAASPAITISGIVPGTTVPDLMLANQQVTWLATPKDIPYKSKQNEPPFLPINIKAQIHEIGDPSIFLSALSTAVSGNATSLTTAVTNAISPTAIATAQQTAATNQGALSAAQAQVQSDTSKYLVLCAAHPTSASDKMAARAAYNTIQADMWKANAAADAVDAAAPYAIPGDLPTN